MTQGMEPFERQELVDKPGIVGAKWWHAALVDEAAKLRRRQAIRGMLIFGGIVAGLGAIAAFAVKAAAPDTKDERKYALEMQKNYGWNFGAIGEPLVFDGETYKPFEPSAIPSLPTELAPRRADLKPFYQRTLFDAPEAFPAKLAEAAPDDVSDFKKLKDVLKPIESSPMKAAYVRGQSIASLFTALSDLGRTVRDGRTALIVDLPGPQAVAFAAGATPAFDPVFLFDNWPHPRGVVRSHETVAAAAFYQPIFAKSRDTDRLPMFVLDRQRLAPYTDDATQFDNRYTAKLPWPAASMAALGVKNILYVVPTSADTSRELDDLNDDFVDYAKAGLNVKVLPLDAFQAGTSDEDPKPPRGDAGIPKDTRSDTLLSDSGWVYYGGSPRSHFGIYNDYALGPAPRPATLSKPSQPGARYAPAPRSTPYSAGKSLPPTQRPRPTTFGSVPVIVAVGTGAILGARYARSGSWNRSSGGWGG